MFLSTIMWKEIIHVLHIIPLSRVITYDKPSDHPVSVETLGIPRLLLITLFNSSGTTGINNEWHALQTTLMLTRGTGKPFHLS